MQSRDAVAVAFERDGVRTPASRICDTIRRYTGPRNSGDEDAPLRIRTAMATRGAVFTRPIQPQEVDSIAAPCSSHDRPTQWLDRTSRLPCIHLFMRDTMGSE